MNIEKYLFTPLLKSNYLEFFKMREVITKIFLVITIVTFITLWSIASDNINSLTFWSIIFLSPIFCFTFYHGVYGFLFRYNWFYIIYFICSLSLLSLVMIKLNERYEYVPFIYEITFLLTIGVFGYSIPLVLSVPFKILNHLLFNTNSVYYHQDLVGDITNELYARKPKDNQSKISVEATKYDVMNEIQLQVELKNALAEDRFEDANLIKKALEKLQ